MSSSGSSGIGPPGGDSRRSHHQQYAPGHYQTEYAADGHRGRPATSEQQYYGPRTGAREDTRRTATGMYSEEPRKSGSEKSKQARHNQSDGRSPPDGGGGGGGGGSGRHGDTSYKSSRPTQPPPIEGSYAPTTGQMRSGHLEIDSLYSGSADAIQVNSMNAPNNSTVQCGCENIDCPFCNLMMSVQMKQ